MPSTSHCIVLQVYKTFGQTTRVREGWHFWQVTIRDPFARPVMFNATTSTCRKVLKPSSSIGRVLCNATSNYYLHTLHTYMYIHTCIHVFMTCVHPCKAAGLKFVAMFRHRPPHSGFACIRLRSKRPRSGGNGDDLVRCCVVADICTQRIANIRTNLVRRFVVAEIYAQSIAKRRSCASLRPPWSPLCPARVPIANRTHSGKTKKPHGTLPVIPPPTPTLAFPSQDMADRHPQACSNSITAPSTAGASQVSRSPFGAFFFFLNLPKFQADKHACYGLHVSDI